MFRKTLIRLFLVTMVATLTLVVFAATRQNEANVNNKECMESCKDREFSGQKSEFMILEAIGQTILSKANY